jgi:type IV pilus assembly protein PilA
MLFKMMKRLKKEEKGFTLIELLAVIVILAVIAAIAVPYILGVINKSKADSDIATARQVYDAARLYVTSELSGDPKNQTIAVNEDSSAKGLIKQGYLDKGLVLPSTKNLISGGEVKFTSTGELWYVSLSTTAGTKYLKGTDVIASTGEFSSSAPPTPTP